MQITFIQTGGTIDKDYPRRIRSYAFEIADPAVARILKKVNPHFRYKIISLLRKDSLDMTDEDRALIYKACEKSTSDKIIITHGTDTMIVTAKALSTITNKTIILTGSLMPERFENSDAMFNVGMAVAASHVLPHGVYIVMSGNIYPWNKCQKSERTAKFIAA